MDRRSISLRRPAVRGRSRQEGVVLMIALIVLVAMTLAGLGIIRSIDSGSLVAGNIGFRNAALTSTDGGAEQAIAWLIANRSNLNADIPVSGYYSTRQDNLDITGNKTAGGTDGVDWGGSDPSQPVKAFHVGVDTTGNDVFYIIHRLCAAAGDLNDPGQSCTVTSGTGLGSGQGSPTYDWSGLPTALQVYYRITIRATGPKNTVSYAQAFVVI